MFKGSQADDQAPEDRLDREFARKGELLEALRYSQRGHVLPDMTCPNCCINGRTVLTVVQRTGNFRCSLCHASYIPAPT